jgi:hypothetical protein
LATVGKEARALTEDNSAEPEIVESEMPALSFLGVGVAMAAILAGHGYHELGGYCANRCGERAATLSVPQRDGGHVRYRVVFPEVMRLDAERVE